MAKQINHPSDESLPTSTGTSVPPTMQTLIWDWDAPYDGISDTTSPYYYEPQGELLNEPQEHRPSVSEFKVPQSASGAGAVTGAGSDWMLPDSTEGNAPVSRQPSSSPTVSVAGVKRKAPADREPSGSHSKPPELKRVTLSRSQSGEDGQVPSDGAEPASTGLAQKSPATTTSTTTSAQGQTRTESADNPRPNTTTTAKKSLRPPASTSKRSQDPSSDSSTTLALPARKVFPIQVGDQLFRLSGASISSDAPSYFSRFFEDQLRQNEGADSVRTLFIDRDPSTFKEISLHLQGYYIQPRDGTHFVRLFADAQYYGLPRLMTQLNASTIYIRIGETEFQIPRDLFSSPGDSPNYFSLGFSVFLTTPNEAFPGLSQQTLLRPPSMLPPSVPNRSARTFQDLLHVLKGYPVDIRNEQHRAELLRDARYFHLKGLEQRLIPHQISYNLARKKSEIVIRLEDIRQSGVSFVPDNSNNNYNNNNNAGDNTPAPNSPLSTVSNNNGNAPGPGWVNYQRPYVDSEAYNLIIETQGEEDTFVAIAPGSAAAGARIGRATFHRQTLSRITSLFSVVANKMNLPVTQPLGLMMMMMERNGAAAAGAGAGGSAATPSVPSDPSTTGVSEDKVKVRIGLDAHVIVDGKTWLVGGDQQPHQPNPAPPEEAEENPSDPDSSSMDVDAQRASSTATRLVRTSSMRRAKSGRDDELEAETWVVRKAQWRLRVQHKVGGSGESATDRSAGAVEIILGAVKIDAFSSERGRNMVRGFL